MQLVDLAGIAELNALKDKPFALSLPSLFIKELITKLNTLKLSQEKIHSPHLILKK